MLFIHNRKPVFTYIIAGRATLIMFFSYAFCAIYFFANSVLEPAELVFHIIF